MEKSTLVRALEAILFVASDPVPLKKLEQVFEPEEVERCALRDALDMLRRDYSGRGVELHEIGGGYQLRTGADLGPYLARLDMPRAVKLSQAAMETLAIVAYRQPATRGDVEQVRGVDCGPVMRTMLDRGLVRVLGKKDVPGRPLLYGTTKKFLEVFGLSSLTDLPTLRQIEELTAEPDEEGVEGAASSEPQLPLGDIPLVDGVPVPVEVDQDVLERDARMELDQPPEAMAQDVQENMNKTTEVTELIEEFQSEQQISETDDAEMDDNDG